STEASGEAWSVAAAVSSVVASSSAGVSDAAAAVAAAVPFTGADSVAAVCWPLSERDGSDHGELGVGGVGAYGADGRAACQPWSELPSSFFTTTAATPATAATTAIRLIQRPFFLVFCCRTGS